MEVSDRFHAPPALPPGETAPRTHCVGEWVGPRPDLDSKQKRNIAYSHREQNPDSSVVHPTAKSLYLLSYPGPLNPIY
jgi:hypothetical protein